MDMYDFYDLNDMYPCSLWMVRGNMIHAIQYHVQGIYKKKIHRITDSVQTKMIHQVFFRRCLGFIGDLRAIQYTRARKICPCVWKGAFGGWYPKKLNDLGAR